MIKIAFLDYFVSVKISHNFAVISVQKAQF